MTALPQTPKAEKQTQLSTSTTRKTQKILDKIPIGPKLKKKHFSLKPSLSFSVYNRDRFKPLSFTILAHEWLDEKDFKEKMTILNKISEEELTANKGYTKSIGTQINLLSQKLRTPNKNRCPTCLPYDKNIYIPGPGISYLNASAIHFGKYQYVAAQNPTSETILDFLSAVVNGKSNVIITFTNSLESGEKIVDWWNPARGSILLKNGSRLQFVSEEKIIGGPLPSSERILKRSFKLIDKDATEKKVYQLHYENYPVSGGPDLQLFNKLQDIADHLRSLKAPLFVHCYSGNGPTAAFIIAHSLNQEIRAKMAEGVGLQNLDLNVEGQILDMRAQRDGMLEKIAELRTIYQSLSLRYDEYIVQPLKTKVKNKGKIENEVTNWVRINRS